MSSLPSVLRRMIAKFERRAPLDDDDRQALLNLPYRIMNAEASRYIVREGSSTDHSVIILSGIPIATRSPPTARGRSSASISPEISSTSKARCSTSPTIMCKH